MYTPYSLPIFMYTLGRFSIKVVKKYCDISKFELVAIFLLFSIFYVVTNGDGRKGYKFKQEAQGP